MSRKLVTKRYPDDPDFTSPDTARGGDYRNLSYLAGAVDTNDMGYRGGDPFSFPFSSVEDRDAWRTKYERAERLRRHTVEQGHATYAFKPKA